MARQLLAFASILSIAFAVGIAAPESAAANPLTGIETMSVGVGHTCALTSAGGVKCWGGNGGGSLGNGTDIVSSGVPVDVTGLASGVAAVSASCALTTAGGVKCWGANGSGELGNGSTTDSNTPVDVTGLVTGVAAISAGLAHTCALTTGGGVKCWGADPNGAESCGVYGNCNKTPVDVPGVTSGVVAISSGDSHTCARTTTSGVKCWGYNLFGQLGNGTTTDSDTPVDVTGLTNGVAVISAGFSHTCAVTIDDGVKCWGRNSAGALGDGTNTDSSTPVDVVDLGNGVPAVSAGGWQTCALTTGGGVKCWGGNGYGELGIGSTNSSDTAESVVGLDSGVRAISAGYDDTCAVTMEGAVKCWGINDFGQLGTGNGRNFGPPTCSGYACSTTPVDVVLSVKVTLGDANCDGNVDAVDAAVILQLAAGLISTVSCSQNADVNLDGPVNAIDAALILQYSAGLIPTL